MLPEYNDKGWMGISAETLYRHKDGGLTGTRCGFHMPWTSIRISLCWDSVTCPDCRKIKEAWEPESMTINTVGD